ncbi:MAG: protein kinase [Phototrophicaceae bacterium]
MTLLIKNRYQIHSLIGQGGMGAVYRAYDRLHRQTLALKKVTVPQENIDIITHSTATASHNDVLAHEFSTLASLRHPNIISVLDYGFDEEDTPFFTMDLIDDGVAITDCVMNKPLIKRVQYLIDILQALRYLHQRGIIHRDLKPANILVANDMLKVLDFGLALDAKYSTAYAGTAGTLAYLAPEILQGKAPSRQSDLYSFGVLAYQILTGTYPFPHDTPSQLIQQVLLDIPTFNDALLDDALSSVIMRLLSKNPEDRYQSAMDTMQAIARAVEIELPLETQDIRESFLVASTFVGREAEVRVLKDTLQKMLDYSSQSILIGGESGIGKTRLMDELRAFALVQGIMVLRGQAVTQNNLAYKIWSDIIPELLLINDISDNDAEILALFVPDISELLERDIVPTTLPDDSIRRRLPLLLATMIKEASTHTPLLIFLEDLQWASEDIEILEAVLGNLGRDRVMIVGNYRNDEAPHLASQLPMEHMVLDRLSDKNIRSLSMAMLGQQGNNEGVLELLKRESEGNAFFLVEVVRALAEEVGQIANIGLSTLPAQIFSGGIKNVIQRRMAKLPDWAIYPIQVSSIFGRQIDTKIIEHIHPNLEIDTWLQICDEFAIFGINGEQWQFIHDKIREYVISELDSKTHKRINQQIASAIETVYEDDLERFYSDLADYYLASNDLEKTSYYSIRGAQYLRVYDPTRAYELVQLAITLQTDLQVNNEDQELADFHHLKGQIAIRLALYDEAQEALNDALVLFESVNDEYGAAKVKNNLGELGYRRNELEGTLKLLQESLPILEAHEDWFYVATVYMHMSLIYNKQYGTEEALPYFHKCLEVMLITGDEVEIAKAYNNLGMAMELIGRSSEGFDYYQKALEIRRRLNDHSGLISSLHNLAFIEQSEGDYDKSIEMRLEALQYALQLKNTRAQMVILNELAVAEYTLGHVDISISYMKQSINIAQIHNNTGMLSHAQIRLGSFLIEHDIHEAKAAFILGLEGVKSTNMNDTKAEGIGYFAMLLYQEHLLNIVTYIECLSAALTHKAKFQQLDRVRNALNTVESLLSKDSFEQAVERGQNQDLNTLIDLLLEIGNAEDG